MKTGHVRLLVVGMWFLSLFLSVIPSVVMYLLRPDDLFCRKHAVQAFHYFILASLVGLLGLALKLILVGYLVLYLLSGVTILVCACGAFQAYQGKEVRIIPSQYQIFN